MSITSCSGTEVSPEVPEETSGETVLNMDSRVTKALYEFEKGSDSFDIDWIGDEILNCCACQTAHRNWEAIERLQLGESLNIQDGQDNLFWEFVATMKSMFNFVNNFNQNGHDLSDCEATTQVVKFSYISQLKFSINSRKFNELRAERMAKNANPLALIQLQKAKEIAKQSTPPSVVASEDDSDPATRQKVKTGQFGNQRAVNVVGARETVGGPVVQQSGIQCFNCKEFGHYAKECRKPKRVRDSTYHKEKMLLCKQAEKGTDVKAIRTVETGDSNVIPDSPNMCDNDIQDDQNDVECDNERAALANLIANLKLDVDDNKKIQKQLKKANATLTQELTECKSILAETSRTLRDLLVSRIVV
ncbi:retrovirus-related pol polyprotein from transposon TNT 1-94 [Tanacetum coccineum]